MVGGGIYGCGQRAPWREAESIKGVENNRTEDRKKKRRREEEGRKKEGKADMMTTNPIASACVSLLSAQSKDGPSKLGQSDVPVTGDRSEGREEQQQGSGC